MPPPPNLADISALRDSMSTTDAEIARLGREIESIRLQREQASRAELSAAELSRMARAESAAVRRQRELLVQRMEIGSRLGGMIGGTSDIIGGDASVFLETPEMAIARLERAVPVAMLPVRIETRFDGPTLHVRIYPDQIHIRQHEADVTAAEVKAAQTYWTEIWRADAAGTTTAWQKLTATMAPERAAFLVDKLQPTNLATRASDASPTFPEAAVVERRVPVQAHARLLPSRWLVTLIASDGRRMLRKWAPRSIPDKLSISPFGDILTEMAQPPAEDEPTEPAATETLAIDEAARWLVDFNRAVEVGMALTIQESELELGSFAGGIGRLVVVGVDWTRTPEDASAALTDHLCSHGYSDGFEFLAPGHVTNNTSAANSDFRSNDRERGEAFPAEPPAQAVPHTAGARLGEALGAAEPQRLSRFPGADSRFEVTTSQVHTALYGAAFGFYVTEVLPRLIDKSVFGNVRSHVQQYVRPAGPFAPIRVGRQPYGVLPVLATPVNGVGLAQLASMPPGFSRDLAVFLAKIRQWLETHAERPLDQLRTMAAPPPGEDPETLLADLLKQSPTATGAKVRPIGGRASLGVTQASLDKAAEDHLAAVNDLFRIFGFPQRPFFNDAQGRMSTPLIYDLFSPEKPRYELTGFPWVAADLASTDAIQKAVAKVRARLDAAAGDPTRTKNFLYIAATDAETLFEGLLLLSATFEYWRAAEEWVRRPEFQLQVQGTLLAEMLAIGPKPATPANQLLVETPRQLFQLKTPAAAGAVEPVALISELHSKIFTHVQPELRDAREFHAALEALLQRPVREVDYAMRGLMDAGSHRLDAWITSLATQRLQAQRLARPRGVHIGGFGIVHDLRPDSTPTSEGYIHVPSADHAVMSAVMRAAHMANRDDKPESFAVRLTSERVRNALYISEGMAQGQRVSALLGYRFERALVDGRHQAQYINAFRKLAPHPEVAQIAGAQESIAARDVVDGLRLAELWREKGEGLFDLLGPLTQSGQAVLAVDRAPLRVELAKLIDLFDSFGDLWSSESVYQLARGNQERAAAALAVLDRQERPPEPLSVQTPRKCWGYAQRVMWALPANEAVNGWPKDIVSKTEPGANAIAARLMGDARRFQLGGQAVGADGAVLADVRLAPLGVEDLGLSPLSIALYSLPGNSDQPSRLEQHIATAFAKRGGVPEGAGLALSPQVPGGAAAGSVGIAAFLALANSVRLALFDRRALTQRDFAPPTGVVADRSAVEPIVERATALEQELMACEAALGAAIPADGAPSIAAVLQGLVRASGVVPVAPWTLTPAAEDAPKEELIEEGVAVRSALTRILALWKETKAPQSGRPMEGVDAAESALTAQLETAILRIRLVFGSGFPVLPPFTVDAPLMTEWQASLGDQQALYASSSKLAVVQWLRTLSQVRAGTRALTGALDAAAWTGTANPAQETRVVQLPHLAGRKWAALPFEKAPPEDVRLSIVVLGELAAAGKPMAGVLLDEWTEAIPESKTTTSVSFQYDAPGARAPQTICLAVDAGVAAGGWTTDSLVDAVNELFDLSRLRLLKPSQIPSAGAVLPTLFIPQNLSMEMPSFNLLGISAAHRFAVEGVLGKE